MALAEGRLDERLVRELVAQAAREVGLGALAPAFTDRVLARLAKGARSYGAGSWRRRPLAELIAEATEEADDVAGWSATTLARIYEELEGSDLPGATEVQLHLVRATGLALAISRELASAARALEQP